MSSPFSLGEMPFTSHLEELRTRLIRTILVVSVLSIVAYYWADDLFALLTHPLRLALPSVSVIGTGPAEAFIVKLEISFAAGVIVSSPWWSYELWAFISPGLHLHEKKLAVPFVLATTLCFLFGVFFCFTMVLPYAFGFFLQEYQSIGALPNIRMEEYLSFVIKLVLVFGGVFEAPVISYFLARLGIVKSAWLLHHSRMAIVVIFIIAAIFTPPDVVTQCLLAVPMMFLYGLCIFVTQFAEKSAPKKEAAADAAPRD